MADTEKQTLVKVVTLMAAQRDLLDKLDALAKEIEAVLGGKAGIGAKLKAVERAFKETWATRYAGEYVWVHAKHNALAKRLLSCLSVDELTARMLRYLQSDEPFYATKRHTFELFVASVNSWTGPAAGPTSELDDDVAATKRKMAAMRGGQ